MNVTLFYKILHSSLRGLAPPPMLCRPYRANILGEYPFTGVNTPAYAVSPLQGCFIFHFPLSIFHFSMFRIGFGYDVHRLVEGRELWLGGIKIDHSLGLLGHSDADVLIHAICDALLGAANMRDIGYHFPDTSADTLNMDSKIILKKTIELIQSKGYSFGNLDATVCAERPKLNPHVPAIKQCLAEIIGTDEDNISIKATTTERLGFTGREEGISAYAVVLINS